MPCYCYIVKCSDDTLYTGWTTDPAKLEKQHNTGRGASYTRVRRPVRLVYIEEQPDRRSAMKREIEIKRMTRSAKDKLVLSQIKP